MNARALILAPFALMTASLVGAPPAPDPQVPVPVTQAPPTQDARVLLTSPAGENQRLYGPSRSTLIDPAVARELLGKYRAAFVDGQTPPCIVVYVNRDLVDLSSGLQLTGHTEKYAQTTAKKDGVEADATTETSGENTYAVKDAPKATIADQQTVRELERLFGRVFRQAGALLADQKTAASLLIDQPGRLTGDQAAKDRAALASIADVAIEVLISSRNLTLAQVSGDADYAVPDLQVTAIRLKDSVVIGQAAASDIIGKGRAAGAVVRQFDVRDIAEATAFALIEDLLTGK